MAETLEFELVAPEKLLLSQQVAMVVVPGGDGDFGVLPRHSLLISTVRPGVISVYETRAQVSKAVAVEDSDRTKTEQELKDAREDVEDAKTDFERDIAKRQIVILEAKLTALRH